MRARACWWRCGSGEGFPQEGHLSEACGGQAGSEVEGRGPAGWEVLRASRRAWAPMRGPFSTSATRRLSKQDSMVLSVQVPGDIATRPRCPVIWDGGGLPTVSLADIPAGRQHRPLDTKFKQGFSQRRRWGPGAHITHLLILSTWTSPDGRGHPPAAQKAMDYRTQRQCAQKPEESQGKEALLPTPPRWFRNLPGGRPSTGAYTASTVSLVLRGG